MALSDPAAAFFISFRIRISGAGCSSAINTKKFSKLYKNLLFFRIFLFNP